MSKTSRERISDNNSVKCQQELILCGIFIRLVCQIQGIVTKNIATLKLVPRASNEAKLSAHCLRCAANLIACSFRSCPPQRIVALSFTPKCLLYYFFDIAIGHFRAYLHGQNRLSQVR